jgi:hypothetical protein
MKSTIFFLLAISSSLFLMIIPYQVKAGWVGGFNCFGEPQCEAGWGAGLGAAVTDWHGGLYAHILNSGDYNCWQTYSDAKCHGFIHGYIYEWTQLWLHEHNMTKTPTTTTGAITNKTIQQEPLHTRYE